MGLSLQNVCLQRQRLVSRSSTRRPALHKLVNPTFVMSPRLPGREEAVCCHAAEGAFPLSSSPLQPEKPRLPGFSKEELTGYMRMARLHNTLPALLLVLVGAWAGTGRSPSVLSNMTVWTMALISAGVSAASMVINDYFDWVSGTDQVNAPDKPLPSGQVKPDMAVLLGGGMYVGVLMAACFMDNPVIRAIIAFSAGATLLYTPVLKRVTLVKNALVATVIALAPLSGALAAGAGMSMVQRLACPSLFAFTAIMFREVLMDCSDEKGDRQAGVITLPVLIGAPAALLMATVLMLGGAGAAVAALVTSHATSTVALPAGILDLPWPHLACMSLVGLTLAQLVVQVVKVFQSNFDLDVLSHAVDNCIKPMGLAIIMLAAMA